MDAVAETKKLKKSKSHKHKEPDAPGTAAENGEKPSKTSKKHKSKTLATESKSDGQSPKKSKKRKHQEVGPEEHLTDTQLKGPKEQADAADERPRKKHKRKKAVKGAVADLPAPTEAPGSYLLNHLRAQRHPSPRPTELHNDQPSQPKKKRPTNDAVVVLPDDPVAGPSSPSQPIPSYDLNHARSPRNSLPHLGKAKQPLPSSKRSIQSTSKRSRAESEHEGSEEEQEDASVAPKPLSAAHSALLKDWKISVTKASQEARKLGFSMRQGAFSAEEDAKIDKCVGIICRRKGLSRAGFVQALCSKHGGGSHLDERSRMLEEWRELLMAEIPNRLVKSTQLHARKMYDESRGQGSFTPDEDKRILELHEAFGADWKKIGGLMGRAGDDVKHHYRKTLEHSNNVVAGLWTEEEDQKLRKAVQAAEKKGKQVVWNEVAKAVGTRTAHQCQSHWAVRPPAMDKVDVVWTKDDTLKLLKKMAKHKPENETDVRFDKIQRSSQLSKYSVTLVRRRWRKLKNAHVKAHGESPMQDIIKSIIGVVEKMPERTKTRRKQLSATAKEPRPASSPTQPARQPYKSAEFVDSEEDAESGGQS